MAMVWLFTAEDKFHKKMLTTFYYFLLRFLNTFCHLKHQVKNNFCKKYLFPFRTLEISLVGGFQDDLGKSEELSLRLFRDLVKSDVNFILGLCCIGSLNTTLRRRRRGSSNCCSSAPFPIFYGCGVDVETGDIFPAKFDDQGPGA